MRESSVVLLAPSDMYVTMQSGRDVSARLECCLSRYDLVASALIDLHRHCIPQRVRFSTTYRRRHGLAAYYVAFTLQSAIQVDFIGIF
jgi:hypothetical protein